MQPFTLRIKPMSAFGGRLRGDSLFGHICSILSEFDGARLEHMLEGYLEGHPFMIVGSPRPSGHIARPTIPLLHFRCDPEHRKSKLLKARKWVPESALDRPVEDWLTFALREDELSGSFDPLNARFPVEESSKRTLLGSAQSSMRARTSQPFTQIETWHSPDITLDVDILIDEKRLGLDEVIRLVQYVGGRGHGAGASRGAGKFEVISWRPTEFLMAHRNGNACITLGHGAPSSSLVDQRNSYYKVSVLFGKSSAATSGVARSDQVAVRKTPILLLEPGALIAFRGNANHMFVGTGIGGHGQLTKLSPKTIHQGYAPALRVEHPHPLLRKDR